MSFYQQKANQIMTLLRLQHYHYSGINMKLYKYHFYYKKRNDNINRKDIQHRQIIYIYKFATPSIIFACFCTVRKRAKVFYRDKIRLITIFSCYPVLVVFSQKKSVPLYM
jgi:hypothetical protein